MIMDDLDDRYIAVGPEQFADLLDQAAAPELTGRTK